MTVIRGPQMTLRMVTSDERWSVWTSARFGSPSAFRTDLGSSTARARISRIACCPARPLTAAPQSALNRSRSNTGVPSFFPHVTFDISCGAKRRRTSSTAPSWRPCPGCQGRRCGASDGGVRLYRLRCEQRESQGCACRACGPVTMGCRSESSRGGELMSIPSTMKAVVLHGADEMRVQTWPVPELGPGEVLLKVEVASICGTDVKVLHRKLQGQPEGQFIMGHEYAGTVAVLGPDVDEFRVGDRVAVEVHKGCERCENCIKGWYTSCLNYGDVSKGHRAKGLTCDGGFAEYAVNHINTLYRLPENLTFEQACMVTTAASPLWAIDLMGGYVAGETVLVQGPGPIGLIAVQLCKALGAARVILAGTRDSRLAIVKRLWPDFTINVHDENLAERVREITGGHGADSVLECAGGPTSMQEALENVKRGGRIGVVAWYSGPVQVDMNLAVRSNVRIYAARGEGGMNCGRSLALMSAGKILADPIITHHFRLDQINDAFRTYTERTDNALKVVIRV